MGVDVLGDLDWFRENRPEEPVLLTLYHGTTHEFSEFSDSRVNPENMFGRQHYFTSCEQDAEVNYASLTGPDLKNRIEHAAELAWNAEEHDTLEEAIEAHQAMFYGGREAVLTVELTLRNPVILGKGADHGLVMSWDDAYSQALTEVAAAHGVSPDEAGEDDDLLDEVSERASEMVDESAAGLIDKVAMALSRLNCHEAQAGAASQLAVLLMEEPSLDKALETVSNKEPYIYLFEDENYSPVCAPVLCELLHLNGHDAIICPEAHERCRNIEMSHDAAHVALFSDCADQIRIIDRRDLSCGPSLGM